MNLAYVYRIYPSKEQEILLHKTFGSVRFIYNQILSKRKEIYEKYKEDKQSIKLQKLVTPATFKEEFPWLKEVDSLALSNAQLNLDKAYKNFFRKKSIGFPKFKSKHKDKKTYTTNNQKGTIRLVSNHLLRVPKLGNLKIKLHRPLATHSLIKSATLSMSKSGRYYISLLLEILEESKATRSFDINSKVLALDYSSSHFYVDSESRTGDYPKFYRNTEKKLAREQRKLSKKIKGSSNRNKQKRKVARVHEKIAYQRKDFLHKKSREIANLYDFVVVEDLNLRGLSGALKLGKSTLDNGFGMFREFLSYKLKRQSKTLVIIDKFFPSSKLCSACLKIKKELSLSQRIYYCENCHLEIDRDLNASLNLKREAIRVLSG